LLSNLNNNLLLMPK